MKKFQEKRRAKKIIYSIGTIVILVALVLWLGGAVVDVYEKAKITKDRRLEVLQELEELQKTESDLRARIEALTSERGVEEAVREKFDVAKEGEEMIKIIDAPERIETEIEPVKPWWKFF